MRATAGRRVVRVAAVALVTAAAWVLVAPGRVVPAPPPDGSVGSAGSPGALGTAPTPEVATPPVAVPDPDGSGPDGLRVVELRGGWRTGEDLGTAVAIAVMVGTAEAEVVAVEAVEQPGPGAAVVTLLVAAPPGGDRAATGGTDRLVVPVRLDGGAVRPAGPTWRLPGPTLTPDPPTGRPVADPELVAAARAALAAAGLDPSVLHGLDATDGWPFVVRTEDDADDGPASGPWLRWHLDRFVVTGLPLHPAAGSGRGAGTPEGGEGHGAGTRGPDDDGP